MAEVDTSSYLKPQPPSNPLDQITKFGQAADVMGKVEAGKAVQGAILPDGSIDRNALAQSLRGTVAGSMQAIPTLNAYETLRTAGHVADQAGYDNFQKRMETLNRVIGSVATKDAPTIDDVNSAAATILHPDGPNTGAKYGFSFPTVMGALKNFRGPDGRPLPSALIKQRAMELQSMAQETLRQIELNRQRSDQVDTGTDIRRVPTGSELKPQFPTSVKRIPTGTPQVDNDPASPNYRKPVLTPPQPPAPDYYLNSRGQRMPAPAPQNNALSGITAPGPQAAAPQTFDELYKSRIDKAPVAGLAPGAAAAATTTAENSARMGNELASAANEIPATRGILDNLERELKGFTPGPGADWKRMGKALANTVIPDSLKGKIGFDPKSIADQEGFNKLAFNLAQNQFQALGGTGTDAKLNSTMHTSPSELLSSEGNASIIRLLKGNTDALAVKSREWNKWKKTHGEDSYPDFSEQFNENFNPRVFQLKYVPKSERQSWYEAMSPDERRAFERSAKFAKDQNWLRKGDLQ